uniref:Protocadherin gamma-C3 n=1 Tax=Gopherus agassizii TaxID=38772 RepID=A0A452IZ84_9SAUR
MGSAVESRGFLQWQVGALLLVSFPLRGGGQAAHIRYSIPEELAPGSFVGDVARDLGLDAAQVASRQLQILPGSAQRHFRAEAQSGVLVVEERIDRERLCDSTPRCLLYLEILLANPLASHRVEVEVLDVNDNSPAFLTSLIRLEIAESAAPGARFPLEPAEDLDFGTNSVSTYRLSPPGCFTLSVKNRKDGSKNPELVLEKALDREQQEQHRLVLTALDGGLPAKSGTAEIVVSVIDANDNPPVFDQPVYKVTLLENAPEGTMVIKLNATDQDEGTNGEIAYSFSSHTRQKIRRLFSLQERSGEVRVLGNVDYEEGTIYELASLGARFPIHQAQDPDVGSNALQTYHLSANENFSLNVKARTDGSKFPELVLERALDREHRAVHHLVLTAEDGGSPPRSSKTRIAVQVLDANDNHPVFDKPSYQARLVENCPSGTLVIKLNATDVDEGPNGNVRYSLGSHNSEALRRIFTIDSQTGEIRVQGNLDFEEASVYEIEVEAKDMGSPTMEEHCSVTVEITDVNDNPPEVVLTSFSSSLSEDAPPGTVVAVIHVKDRDSGEHGRVQCHLPRSLPFKLRKDFEHQYSLLTSQGLDRERVSQYNVTISASDLGSPPLSRHTVLSITLADINDNTPQFERTSYEVVVKENNPVGEILVTVSATDPDLDQNSRLSYSVLSSPGKGPAADPSAYISINPTSGQVSAKLPFDYEQTTYFQFQVEASDGGSPALSSRTVVHVFVTDQNDNAPGIQFPLTGKDSVVQFRIPRSTSPQALITKIIAVDLDSGRNAWLAYRLMQATDPSLFGVALRSGEIRTTRALQEQDAATQELFLVVKDSGEPPMSTSVTVLVLLEENVPEAFLGLKAQAAESESVPRLTLYLIISLVIISALSLAALVGLGVRCVRGDARAAVGCCVKADTLRVPPNPLLRHVQYQPSMGDATIDMQVTATAPLAREYRSCFSPVSDISEFMFIKPSVTLGNSSGNSPPDRSFSTEVSSLNVPMQCPQLTPPCDLQRICPGRCVAKARDVL